MGKIFQNFSYHWPNLIPEYMYLVTPLIVACFQASTLQSLYYATRYNTVLVVTRPGLGSQMIIFLQFLYKIIP